MLSDYEKRMLSAKLKRFGKLKVCVYCRKSQKDESGNSIDTQINNIYDFIKDINKTLNTEVEFNPDEDWFYEDNVSGTSVKKRTQFRKMQNEIEDNPDKYQACLVYRYDRFARNFQDFLNYRSLMLNYGCLLLACNFRFDGTSTGEFAMSVDGLFNQQYAIVASEFVVKGMTNLAKQGKCLGSLPYGLISQDKNIVVNQKEARVVKKIFRLASEGNNLCEIVQKLSNEGIVNRKNKPFTLNDLSRMLRNPKYIGRYIWSEGDVDNKKRKRTDKVYKGLIDEVRIDNAFEAIIDTKTWDKVQEYLALNKENHYYSSYDTLYLLSGIMTCKDCGKAITGERHSGGSQKKMKRYYTCRNHQVYKNCSTKMINADYVDTAIKSIVTKLIDQFISDHKDKIKAECYKELDELMLDIEDSKQRIKECQEQINKIIKLQIKNYEVSDVYNKQLIGIRNDIKAEKEILSKKNKRYEDAKVLIDNKCNDIKIDEEKLFKDKMLARSLIKAMFDKILFSIDGIELIYKDGK